MSTVDNSRQVIAELEEKVGDYEQFIEKLLSEHQATIGVIQSKPFNRNGDKIYRCDVDGKVVLAKLQTTKKKSEDAGIPMLFELDELKINSEVAIIKDVIVGSIPKILLSAKEKNDFSLISWDRIGGLKSQLERIRETVELPLQHPELITQFGLPPVKGMLLYGPPGCGKTIVARAIASTILRASKANDDSFHYVKGGELLTKYVGETERKIGEMFKQTRRYAKETGQRAFIFIDEAEAILPKRGSRQSSDVDKTIVPTFLSEMDGFDDNSPFILLSTNHPNSIDEAVLRPGRIDIKIEISRPTQEDAVDILKIHLSNVKLAEDIDTLANQGAVALFASPAVSEVSGAMCETIVKLATQNAVTRHIKCGTGENCKPGLSFEDIQISINNLN